MDVLTDDYPRSIVIVAEVIVILIWLAVMYDNLPLALRCKNVAVKLTHRARAGVGVAIILFAAASIVGMIETYNDPVTARVPLAIAACMFAAPSGLALLKIGTVRGPQKEK
jgi:hypothetical protein